MLAYRILYNRCGSATAANVLLRAEAGATACGVKLADFGVAAQLATIRQAATFVGTPYFMAPEVIGVGKYDEKVTRLNSSLGTFLRIRNGFLVI